MLLVAGLCACVAAGAQETGAPAVLERAVREFRGGDFAAAERDFRELTKADHGSLFAYSYLGHSLFHQRKFNEAIVPYERARELERTGSKISETEHRILVDQLVMSYGIGGQLPKAHKLLEEAIRQYPGYPLNC